MAYVVRARCVLFFKIKLTLLKFDTDLLSFQMQYLWLDNSGVYFDFLRHSYYWSWVKGL